MIKINDLEFSVSDGRHGRKKLIQVDELNISQGSFVLITGETGSGKSTLLSLIGGMNRPTSGTVKVLDRTISKLSDHFLSEYRREQIGFLFQFFHLIDNLSVFDNIALALVPYNLSFSALQQRVELVVKQVGLKGKEDFIAQNLSGGERQKCALARAIINNPSILIADEPTANLDKAAKLALLELLYSFNRNGMTVLVVSHDPLFEDNAIIDQKIVMSSGKVIAL